MGHFYGAFIRGLDLTGLLKTLPVVPLDPSNYHVTIVYIGDKKPPRGVDERIAGALVRERCFTISLGEPVLLPSEVRPRVLALGISDGVAALSRIRNTILSILRDLNVNVGDRFLKDFKPHVTIGYIRARVDPMDLKESIGEVKLSRDTRVIVREISLIRAVRGIYEGLISYTLDCT